MNQGKENDSGSFTKKFIIMYFERLIRINHQTQNSLLFIITVEIWRFLLGHTLVFAVFLVDMLDQTQNGIFYSALKQPLDTNVLVNYQLFRAISLCWLGLELLFLIGFSIKQSWQYKFNIVKVLYFLMKYSKISCELMFSIFGITFYGAMNNDDVVMIIVIIVEIVIALVLFKLTAIYQQKNIFESHDAYTHNHNLGVELTNLVFCLLTFIGTLLHLIGMPVFLRTVLILFWAGLQLLRLKTTVVFPYYQMQTTHFLYSIGVCLQTVQLIIQAILHFSKLEMISNNTLWMIILLTIFLFTAVRNFNNYLVDRSYFTNIEDLKSEQQFYLLINSYYSAYQSLKQNNNVSEVGLIVTSIRRDHQNFCKNPDCYCTKDLELKDFLKHYLYDLLIKLQTVFSNNHQIMLYIFSFKFHVYEHYIKIHQQLDRLDKIKEMGWLQLLLSMALKYKLKKWIDEKNKQNKVIRICLAIRLQEDMSILNDLIIEDIEIRYKKWNSFSKQLSRMEEVRNMSNKELMNYIKIEQIKNKKWQDYHQSPIFNLILYFYFKRIALKMDDLTVLENNIKDLNRKVKQEELNKLSLFSKYLFHHNACTIEMSIRPTNVGTVINTSKSIFRVFGYSSKRIIGENVSILIPHFLSKQYSDRLKDWIDREQSIKNISKVSPALCLHKENITFSALQYYKIYPAIEQITLITTFFVKNDNDLILINDKGGLQSFGRGLKPLLKNLPHRIECNFVFKNMLKKISNAQFQQQKHAKTIIFNEATTNDFLNGKKKILNSSNETKVSGESKPKKKSKKVEQMQKEKQAILGNSKDYDIVDKAKVETKNSIPSDPQILPQTSTVTLDSKLDVNMQTNELLSDATFEYENIWKIHFNYKKEKYGNQQFYKLQMKGLQPIKNFQDYVSKNEEGMQMGSMKGDTNNSDKIVQDDAQNQDLGEQENSSMTSFTSQLGYGISKLVSHFTLILLNPQKLQDRRMKKKFLIEIVFTLILTAILSTTLVINKYSLDQKVSQLQANSDIDRVFHYLQSSTNLAFNMYSYRNDPISQQIAISQLQWQTGLFNDEVNRQFGVITQEVTSLSKQVLFDYLQTPSSWSFKPSENYTQELLLYFKMNFYLFWDIRDTILKNTSDIYSARDDYIILTSNAPQLRLIRNYLQSLTEKTLANNGKFNTTYMIVSLLLFVTFSICFVVYQYTYRKFRFDQTQDHLQLYQMIPPDVLKVLSEYYAAYYKHYVVGKLRIDSSLDQEKKLFQLEIEDKGENHQISVNKVKLVGRQRFWQWIPLVVIFLLLNGGNIVITYNMYVFNEQVQFFSHLTDNLSTSQSMLLSRWIRIKSTYYFSHSQFNSTFLDFIQSFLDPIDVKFDAYATFQDNSVTQGDSSFRQEFNQLLTANPCVLNQNQYSAEQLAICNKQAVLSKNGLITFVNGFSRCLMNLVLNWKKNFDSTTKQTDYIETLKQFRQFDMVFTFHIPTFNKLNQKLQQVYENGFNTEFKTYFVIFILLILLLVVSYLVSLYLSFHDKVSLSYLYGYAILFPAYALKQSKYLLKFIQTNLEFSQKH